MAGGYDMGKRIPNGPAWWLTKDGDVSCLALYERHYSCYRYADERIITMLIVGGIYTLTAALMVAFLYGIWTSLT